MDDERSEQGHGVSVRRIELTMRRPRFALYAGVRPTLVVGERGQPTQWGPGTWQVPADRAVVIEVFLFNRLWRFGRAEASLTPYDDAWEYRAPMLPFLRGRLRPARLDSKRV